MAEKLFTAQSSPVLGRVSGKTAGAEWAQDGVSYASSHALQSWHLDNVLMAIQPYPSLFRSSHTRDRSWKVAFIFHWQQEQRIPTKHKNLLRTYGSPFTQERSKPVSKSISRGNFDQWLLSYEKVSQLGWIQRKLYKWTAFLPVKAQAPPCPAVKHV